MFKKTSLLLLLFSLSLYIKASPVAIKTNELLKILILNDQKNRDRQLIAHIKSIFRNIPEADLSAAKIKMHDMLVQYRIDGVPAFDYFIESECLQRTNKLQEAEVALIKAIQQAHKTSDHYLQYSLYSHLAFLQTYRGNTIDAVSNFRMANKEAINANDADLQVVIDINISDIYYKNNFYNQSLYYLNQAELLVNNHRANEPRLQNIVFFNKAEIYFRQKNTDSLKKYTRILMDSARGDYKIYTFRKRTAYYLDLLQKNHKSAIGAIRALQKDSLYRWEYSDAQCLADAYYNARMPDSARAVINRLLADPALHNHPEQKFHLYELLGAIAEKDNDHQAAARNYKLALQQLEDQLGRLTQVGNISSEMKLDEAQETYEGGIKKQRQWLIFTVLAALLTITTVAVSYRNIKQKRYYEKLLFDAKKEELSFINSHEVRRHLSNILGIVDIIKNSDDKHQEYLAAEKHLLSAAQNLDEAIKNISEKLDN